MAQARIGISGWTYKPWRGEFYPKGLRQKDELSWASRQLTSIEVNGSFYALQKPESYRAWAAATPDDFVFSVKGSRFITHMKKLAGVEQALTTFFESGVYELGPKLGPVLWQLPPNLGFDADRLSAFFDLLPRTVPATGAPLRHAMEVRHDSFKVPAFPELLRQHEIALVTADTAGKWPFFDELTADFAYARLHGSEELYVSGYDPPAIRAWAQRVRAWLGAGRDTFVYFDNDVKVRAPFDARALAAELGVGPAAQAVTS
ncbi:uncharacterized protein YecE (DUF72 family) [Motilibacter peucedani]|uniref:Uncharacterized protein YecE (DUF72 family) n=1 Tax=Motilibacter peucedani TaxID=598650 RepID=A0A420XN52_9ACTN|nr:DUF72 domain-containing protein [Motilibacter peucedani]RKS72695.1 uncharacterized protein YecE (DUF72 family) [Motilibacter peucedani]